MGILIGRLGHVSENGGAVFFSSPGRPIDSPFERPQRSARVEIEEVPAEVVQKLDVIATAFGIG